MLGNHIQFPSSILSESIEKLDTYYETCIDHRMMSWTASSNSLDLSGAFEVLHCGFINVSFRLPLKWILFQNVVIFSS